MTVTKETIIKRIVEYTGWNHTKAKRVFEDLQSIIISTLGKGEDILISGFGKFKILKKHARLGRNPHTLKTMKLEARSVVTFKPAETLRLKTDLGKDPNDEQEDN
jgi:integration host factor subunit alpha